MPFQRQFDETQVLDSAMQVFWAKGFEATTVSDLVAATGLQRGSLYAAFKDKLGIFRASLSFYDQTHCKGFLGEVARQHNGADAILTTFSLASQTSDMPAGCLIVNTALELSPHEPGVAEFVKQSLEDVEAFFASKVEEAQTLGEVCVELDAQQAAKSLLGLLMGLRVVTRAGCDQSITDAIISQAKAVLSQEQ